MEKNLDYIGKIVDVTIDRPLGSRHPKFSFNYKVNYGFIPDTISGDGEELDAYVLGEDKPLKNFRGKVIAIIRRLSEDDDKLIVVEPSKKFTNDEIEEMVAFQEQWFEHTIIR